MGGKDIDKIPATLDLNTGHVEFADARRLRHSALNMDGAVWTHRGGIMFETPSIGDSIPANIARDDIATHIRQHGYCVTIDVNGIHYAGTEGMA